MMSRAGKGGQQLDNAKDGAMRDWCARVTQQTDQQWQYARVNQADFEARVPRTLAEAIQGLTLL